jgi:Domain of unknown function (DUF3854)
MSIKPAQGNSQDGQWEHFWPRFPWLMPQHANKLRRSGISVPIARARGYESVTGQARLLVLGFKPYQCRLPGLLIPLRDGKGRIIGYQYRPDNPRVEMGRERAVKYEIPGGVKHRLDAPVATRPALKDTSVPLIITEGAIKADSAVSHGYAALSIAGVWAWSGPVARNDLRCVAWEGREALVVFDSDVAENEHVQRAELRLVAFLASLGALPDVFRLPPKADGSKQGLDDFLASGARLRLGGRE